MYRPLLLSCLALLALTACTKSAPPLKPGEAGYQRPNFVFIVSDDQSWEHTSFAGYPFVSTPAFDRIARSGVYFNNAYASAPTCTASRSSILTGQYPWRLKSGAMLGGLWPNEFNTFQSILKQHGYHTGYTGKGWGPGHIDTPDLHPEGFPYYHPPSKKYFWQRNKHPYVSSLEYFLSTKPDGRPFSIWIGANEPHRPYPKGDPARFGNAAATTYIPGFLPDTLPVKEDLAAYLTAIETFDDIVKQVMEVLKSRDDYNNTIIVVTSDNGMPFSRAKTQNYAYGVKVPLAIFWPDVTKGNNRVLDMVGLYDIAPTFLEAAEIQKPEDMNGKSLLNIIYSNQSGQVEKDRTAVFTATERHSFNARPNHEGYPSRAIHTKDYEYILNYFPDRWPAGNEFAEAEMTLLVDLQNGSHMEPYFSLATAKRPREELYDLNKDPFQLHNVIDDPACQNIRHQLAQQLADELKRSNDPDFLTGKDAFSHYEWESPAAP